jgi:hypothetical protein
MIVHTQHKGDCGGGDGGDADNINNNNSNNNIIVVIMKTPVRMDLHRRTKFEG